MNPIQGTTFATGCLIEFKLQKGVLSAPTPTTSPPMLVAYVMQRFGVLLAVNDTAHHLFPFLPVASAFEKQLAQQWTMRSVIKNAPTVGSRGKRFIRAAAA